MDIPISLIYMGEVKYLMSPIIKILTIQTLFNIPNSNIYLQDYFENYYFPNSQGEFLNVDEKIISVQPSTVNMKLETIFINKTDSRFVSTSGDYTTGDHLTTGYSEEWKNSRRSIIKFENLASLNGKKL